MNYRIYTYLQEHARGKKNAIKYKILGNIFYGSIEDKYTRWRKIAQDIHDLRASYLIGTSRGGPAGVYIPCNESEKQGCLKPIKQSTYTGLRLIHKTDRKIDQEVSSGKQLELFL